MTRKKILIATEATIGGVYKHVMLLARHLSKEEFDISVALSPVRNPDCIHDATALKEAGVRCFFIPMQRNISLIRDIQAFLAFHRLIKKERYDAVHFHSSKAGFLGRLAAFFTGTPLVIYTPHCYYFEGKKGLAKYFFVKLEQLASLATGLLINVSEGEKKITLREKIIGASRLVTIKNALDLAEIKRETDVAAIRKKYGVAPGKKLVTGIGRLSLQKNWPAFVKIAQLVLDKRKDVIFLIAGEGEFVGELRNLVEKTGIGQHFLMPGYVKNMNEIYNITDIILSTSAWEAMPYVLLEAMAFGLPIIATDIPGHQAIVFENRNGYVFKPGNYAEAEQKINMLLDNEDLRFFLGRNGYAFLSEGHKLATFIREHEKIYRM